jgi:recombination protein RecA
MKKKEKAAPKVTGTGTDKDIDRALNDIKTKFGDEAIMMLGATPKVDVDAIPTGSIGVDWALGIGGLPRGRIIEIFGPESSGKTTLCLHAIAEAQKKGGICAFIDAEHALDPEYAKKLGVDINTLLVSQPDTGEQALEIVESLVRSGKIDVIVIDSVAALTPKDEIEGDMGAQHVGKQARLMSQALRKLTAIVSKTKTIVIFINQIRMQIGVMFGNPETTPGGKALKFYTSVRIDIRRVAQIKKGGQYWTPKRESAPARLPVCKSDSFASHQESLVMLHHILHTESPYGHSAIAPLRYHTRLEALAHRVPSKPPPHAQIESDTLHCRRLHRCGFDARSFGMRS